MFDKADSPRRVELMRTIDNLNLRYGRDTIRDLRARLDRETEERRRLIAMLVDRWPWWRRWFR